MMRTTIRINLAGVTALRKAARSSDVLSDSTRPEGDSFGNDDTDVGEEEIVSRETSKPTRILVQKRS